MNPVDERPGTLPPAGEDDFHNLEVLNDALLSDDPTRLAAVTAFLNAEGIDTPRVRTIVELRKLREEIHRRSREEVRRRAQSDPTPSPEELSMGAYAEMIESPTRAAVLEMRRKGYDTASSGFGELDFQSVNLQGMELPVLSEATRAALETLGVEIGNRSLSFRCDSADAEAIRARWDAIARALPDLGGPAPDSQLPASKLFRERAAKGELVAWYGRD